MMFALHMLVLLPLGMPMAHIPPANDTPFDPDPAGMEPQAIKGNGTQIRPIWHAVPVVSFAEDVPGRWHAKSGQDRLIAALLGGKQRGYFVDLAANHPIFVSNSRALERDYGWDGLCIEANPRYWTLLQATRACKVVAVAVADAELTVTFVDQRKGGFGGIVGVNPHVRPARKQGQVRSEFQTQTVPFRKLLAHAHAPRSIDYLSLDVEGAETLVMASFPFSSHSVTVLTVEEPKILLKQQLASNDYRQLCRLGSDQVWVRNGSALQSEAIQRIVHCSGAPRCEPVVAQDASWSCSTLGRG